MSDPKQQFAHINIFTPKPGMMEAFVAAQLQGLPLLGDIPGSYGSRLYRARDDRNALLIAFFHDEAAHKSFGETPAFQQHRQRLLPLIETSAPGYYDLIRSADYT